MNKNAIIIFLILVIGFLVVGHIEWRNSWAKENEEYEQLKIDYEILSTSYEQSQETLLKSCNQVDELKEELEKTRKEVADNENILQYEYLGEKTITAYCCEKYPHICGGGNTAYGIAPVPELTCAVADLNKLPFGTVLYIEGVGIRIVHDTGNFNDSMIDIAVEKHSEAVAWKTKKHRVWVIKEN